MFLGAVYVTQCLWFIGTQSLTFDEPVHIVAGLEAWHHGRFEHSNDHPPLARLLCTLPLLRGDWFIEQTDDLPVSSIRPSPEALAWRVRPVNVVLGLILAGLLWATTRRLFSEGAATFALALFVFSPALIAHFSLATTDGVGTLMIFATAAQLLRWRENPSRAQTVLLGVILGGLLLAKFYALPVFVLAVGLVLVLRPAAVSFHPRRWNFSKAFAVVALAAMVVWGMYFFHVSKITFRGGWVTVSSPNVTQPILHEVQWGRDLTVFVPAGEYLVGLSTVIHHNLRGHSSFFLGEVSDTGGWKLYFPVTILLKWPTVVLILFFATVGLAWRRQVRLPQSLRLLGWFPALFFLLAIFSRINIGDRHILPVYPFVLLVTAGLWELARRRRGLAVLVVAGVALQAADSLRYAPDYLSYFNVFVKSEESWKLLADSSLDWGQGLLALRKYQSEHPNERIHLAYYGNVDPSIYGIRAQTLRENERVSGTVVVSAVRLAGRRLKDSTGFRWLLRYPRKALLNHTLHVFEVPEEPRMSGAFRSKR